MGLSLLIKPTSSGCDLRCTYCFYADVSNARDHKSFGAMSLETLEVLVKSALSESQDFCSFGFQGGEPTLRGLDFYEACIRLQEIYNTNGIRIFNTIQTNGMTLDDAWASFFAENKFLVGLSIDGPSQIHDSLRKDARGDATHKRAMEAARLLAKHKVDFNILTVVSRHVAQHPQEVWDFYRKNDFRYIQFIPCLDGLKEAHGSNPFSLTPELYGSFLCQTFDLWYEEYMADEYRSVRMFDNYVQMLMGNAPDSCGMIGSCHPYPVIEADGSVYPCDFYVLDEYRLGSVGEASFAEMLGSATANAFREPSLQIHPNCKECEFGFLCRGGCRRDREPLDGSAATLNCYCESYKRFFTASLDRLTQVARIEREATQH